MADGFPPPLQGGAGTDPDTGGAHPRLPSAAPSGRGPVSRIYRTDHLRRVVHPILPILYWKQGGLAFGWLTFRLLPSSSGNWASWMAASGRNHLAWVSATNML